MFVENSCKSLNLWRHNKLIILTKFKFIISEVFFKLSYRISYFVSTSNLLNFLDTPVFSKVFENLKAYTLRSCPNSCLRIWVDMLFQNLVITNTVDLKQCLSNFQNPNALTILYSPASKLRYHEELNRLRQQVILWQTC